MTRTRDDVLEELKVLYLDADALAEMLVSAQIAHEAQSAPSDVPNDDTTVVPGTAPAQVATTATVTPTSSSAERPHCLLFARCYAASPLLSAHANLVKGFAKADEHALRNMTLQFQIYQPTERPCFLICTSTPTPRLRVLHGYDLFPPGLTNSTPYDNQAFAFHKDSFDSSAPTLYKLEPAWFVPDTARLTTFARFDEAAKQSDDPLVDCTTTKEEALRPICLLPAALAPVLMETKMSPTAAWPILRAFAAKHKIVTQLHPLFTWLSAVGHVINEDCRIDVFAAADMDPVLHQRRRIVSDGILGAAPPSQTT